MPSLPAGRRTTILMLAVVACMCGCSSVTATTPAAPGTAAGTAAAPATAPAASSPAPGTPAAGSPAAATPGASLAYLRRIHTGSKPCAVLGAAGSVWVADFIDTRVSRIDPATGRITAHVRTGAQPCGMAYGARSVWVENYGGDSVTRIDVRTLRTRSYPVGPSLMTSPSPAGPPGRPTTVTAP
jgi:streptogramin lyase